MVSGTSFSFCTHIYDIRLVISQKNGGDFPVGVATVTKREKINSEDGLRVTFPPDFMNCNPRWDVPHF